MADVFRRAFADERAAAAAALRAEVDDVIAGLDHVEVVLDNQHGVAAAGELAKHAHEPFAVGDVQAGRRLIQHVERLAGRCAGKLGRQFDALGLAAGERRGGLPQPDVAQTHVVEGLQLARDARIGGEEVQRFLDGHIEHVGDGFALIEHFQRFAVIALALADLARHVDIRQKVHLDAQNAVAGTGFAAPAAHVEGEAVLLVAARLGFRRGGEDLADHVKQAGVGGRVAARGAADGALIDGDDLVQLLKPVDAVACAGARVRAVEVALEGLVDDFVDERGFAAAGYAGDDRHHAQRNADVDVFQVIGARTAHRQPARGGFAVQRHGDAAAAGEIRARDRFRAGHDFLRRALRDELAAVFARARANIHDLIRGQHGVLVMLDDDQRVADVAQMLERLDEPRVVALVQADGRLIQNVEHADKAGTDLRRQPNALGLAAGERARSAGERQIAKSSHR